MFKPRGLGNCIIDVFNVEIHSVVRCRIFNRYEQFSYKQKQLVLTLSSQRIINLSSIWMKIKYVCKIIRDRNSK